MKILLLYRCTQDRKELFERTTDLGVTIDIHLSFSFNIFNTVASCFSALWLSIFPSVFLSFYLSFVKIRLKLTRDWSYMVGFYSIERCLLIFPSVFVWNWKRSPVSRQFQIYLKQSRHIEVEKCMRIHWYLNILPEMSSSSKHGLTARSALNCYGIFTS